MTVGIYIIRNLFNGKVYVGSSATVEERWTTHKRKLNRGTHHARKLQNAWNKYGASGFEFRIIEEVSTDQLVRREQYWIDACLSFAHGYNSRPKADSCLGIKRGAQSPEHKRKNALAKTGINNPNYGKPRSEETKQKIAQAQAGKPRNPHSNDTKIKMSAAHKQWYQENGVSVEHYAHLQRVRKLRVYKPHSEETKKRMSESHRRRLHG